jgi:uncharacterized protein (TIRG00374 family)
MRRRWVTAIGIVFTLVSLYIAFRGIHLHQLLTVLGRANYWWGAPVLGATLLSIWLRALRWKLMLEPVKRVSTKNSFSATMIGFMANNIFPMRLGELVRAYALGRNSRVSKSSAFATIVVERAFDLLAILLFLGVMLLKYSFARWVAVSGYIALVACVGMFVVMALLRWKRAATMRVFNLLTARLPEGLEAKVNGLMFRFLDGLEVLASGRHVLWITVLSLATWLAMAASYYLAGFAFGLVLPIHASIVLVVVTALAVMLPSGPGFVGTFELGCKYGLMLFKVGESLALSYALFYHAVQFVPITVLGLVYVWREKFSLSRAVDEEEDEEPK